MKPWNKGLTKYTNISVLKISKTLRAKKRSNFARWQKNHRPHYKIIKKSKLLAEFYGTLLGDGCIEKFPRTDKLSVSFNRKEQDHLIHVKNIITKLFGRKPSIRQRKQSLCDDLYLYQQHLHRRLKFPYGRKLNHKLDIPIWIRQNKTYTKHCLKGLFETDGDWVIDKKYKTNVIKFSNRSQSLLDRLHEILIAHSYHPQRRKIDVRIARQKEVRKFVDWIKFRKYK